MRVFTMFSYDLKIETFLFSRTQVTQICKSLKKLTPSTKDSFSSSCFRSFVCFMHYHARIFTSTSSNSTFVPWFVHGWIPMSLLSTAFYVDFVILLPYLSKE